MDLKAATCPLWIDYMPEAYFPRQPLLYSYFVTTARCRHFDNAESHNLADRSLSGQKPAQPGQCSSPCTGDANGRLPPTCVSLTAATIYGVSLNQDLTSSVRDRVPINTDVLSMSSSRWSPQGQITLHRQPHPLTTTNFASAPRKPWKKTRSKCSGVSTSWARCSSS